MIGWAIGAAVVTSLAALLGSAAILLLGHRAERAATWILSFAVGTLTAAATLHLLPESLERRSADEVMLFLLGGILLFVIIERAIRWTHTHTHDDEHHEHREHRADLVTAKVLLSGDALHNFLDGIVLGVAFSSSRELGIIAAVAVIAHELPREVGDFAVLLGSGMSRMRALLLNYLAAFAVVPGTLAAYLWSSALEDAIGWLLPIAAGGFLYIALADLVPLLHRRRGPGAAAAQIVLMILGAALIWFAGSALTHGH